MLSISQWQPALSGFPQEAVYFQSVSFHAPTRNSEPSFINLNNILSSGSSEQFSGGHPPQMISDRLEVLPNTLPTTTSMAPGTSADMLPVGLMVPTNKDWEVHRPSIIRLYRDEDRTLKDVMQIMRTEHKLNATVKMYKSRLATWDVRKYMTWAERETACRIMKLKQGAGEASAKVIVRGKERNPDVILRHMGQSRAKFRRRQLIQDSKHLDDIVIDSIKTQQRRWHIWPTMYAAGPERTIEIICKEMSSLILTTMTSTDDVSHELFHLLCVSDDYLDMNRPAEVRILLNRAAVWFSEAIATEPGKALLSLLQGRVIVGAERFYDSEFYMCFSRHLLDLARERYGSQHSLTSLLMHILQMANEFTVMQQIYHDVLHVIITNLQKRRTSEISRWYYSKFAESLESTGQYQKAQRLLLDAVNSFEGETNLEDIVQMLCIFQLAWSYSKYHSEMHEEAERIFVSIREAGTDVSTGRVDPYYAYYANYGLGLLAEKKDEEEAAVSFYQLSVQAARDEWGQDDSLALAVVGYFALYLRELGREEEAMETESLMRLTDEFSELDLG